KKCLSYHPDKLSSDLSNDEKELAKKKFQAISLAYTILSDEEKRKEYDESGDLYEDDDDLTSKSGMKQWMDYFNSIFPKVTAADIDAFEVKYKCSDEEEEDVLKYYTQFKGDLNKMLECVMLSSDADKQRWVKDYINPAICSGDVDDYGEKIKKTLGSAPAKKRKTKGSAKKKVEEVKKEQSDSSSDSDTPMAEIVDEDVDGEENFENKKSSHKSKKKSASSKASAKKKSSTSKASKPSMKGCSSAEDDLIAQIRGSSLARRQGGFDSLMAGLEDRYGGGGNEKKKKGKKKKAEDDDIDDDEFAKIQAKLMKTKMSRKRN
ncbi:hypothetical protein ACHAXR_001022, partial [Thalassiosira sp. AJA248-18]